MTDAPFMATRPSDLARRAAFRLGETLIFPASREVAGPGGSATIEPKVMQVLLALADRAGEVVTREDLIRTCWNNQFVGDDAVNRAVGEVRRVARTLAGGAFAIETIPRTGYRLTGAAPEGREPARATPTDAPARQVSRRLWIGGGAVVALGSAGWGGFAALSAANRRRARDLAVQGETSVLEDTAESVARGTRQLQQAADLAPGDAAVWGRLAEAWRTAWEFAGPAQTEAAVQNCQRAAQKALTLDPGQPEARTALIELRGCFGDWFAFESGLRAVLDEHPDNSGAMAALAMMLQAVGRVSDGARYSARVAVQRPLAPVAAFHAAYGQWSIGRQAEADRLIDRGHELWPRHPGVWMGRIWLMGFTGRTEVALSQLEDEGRRPEGMGQRLVDLLKLSMRAVADRKPSEVEAAVTANLAAARMGPGGAVGAIMILSMLGRIDQALEVAEGYLLRRGPYVMPIQKGPTQLWINDQRHRKTMMLFVPPTAALRADPRFLAMCRDMGMADYWRRTDEWPDFLGGRRPF